MGELVQVVGHPRRVPEQGHEQVPAGKEKNGEHSQEKQRQQPAPQRHLPQRDASIERIPFHKNLLLGVLAPAGSLRAKVQSPGSRIYAPPLAFPPGFAGSGCFFEFAPRSQWRDRAGLAPASCVPSPPAYLAAQHSRGPRARQPAAHGKNAARRGKTSVMPSLADLIASIPDSPQGILHFVAGLLFAHGYVVIFIGAALDNFGLPASGDVVLFAGGWFSNLGRIGGRPLISRVLKMRFLHFLINEGTLKKVEHYFEAHGGKMVFVGRFGPGLRSMTPLFAGVSRMKYYRFLPYNLSAAAVWAVAYTLVGYVFGEYWNELLAVAKSFGYGIVALVFLVLGTYLIRRLLRRHRREEDN